MAERTADKTDKKRALDLALSQIEKQFGKGSIMKLGAAELPADVASIATGSLSLDLALGIGGLPRGRVVEIFGPEASGKTTLTLHAIGEAQKDGGIAAFIAGFHVNLSRGISVSFRPLILLPALRRFVMAGLSSSSTAGLILM